MKSVFIQIPAYRDLELLKTVQDCIRMSSGRTFLHFGIHNCFLLDEEVIFEYPSARNVKVSNIDSRAPENVGLQLSRKIANSFYSGEDYYFQLDSHMRFVQDWDSILIDSSKIYSSLGIKKPLITQYPSVYRYNKEFEEEFIPDRNIPVKDFSPTRIWFNERPEQFSQSRIPSQTAMSVDRWCGFTGSVSGGFIFTDGSFYEITPNEKIAFWGEEPLIAARAFTHGFDLLTPFCDIVWHLYVAEQTIEYSRRHHVWQDFPDIWSKMEYDSKIEYFRIMTEREVGPYALGSTRTLDEYEQFAGLDFRTGKITQIDLRKVF